MAPEPYYIQRLPGTDIEFRMVQVPGGSFLMGSTEADKAAEDSEKPQHLVNIDSFLMGEFPVTQELWEVVLGQNPSRFMGPKRPVETVSWFDTVVFSNALSEKTGRTPVYLDNNGNPFGKAKDKWILPNNGEVQRDINANGYRLPTEAEWEFAAKGGEKGEGGHAFKYAGSDLLEQVGWYLENSGRETKDVGLLLPNILGLYDMSGNIWEWCADWDADSLANLQGNPHGSDQVLRRVLRGGCYYSSLSASCRSSHRFRGAPDYRGGGNGLRLACPLQSNG